MTCPRSGGGGNGIWSQCITRWWVSNPRTFKSVVARVNSMAPKTREMHKTPTGEIQEDACECLMLVIEIMDKGFGPCPTNYNINSKGSFSEHLFSFVLGKYTICDICTMKSPAFETTSLLYVTPTDSSSMQELLMQEHKQKLYKTCSCCGRDTWHMESKKKITTP